MLNLLVNIFNYFPFNKSVIIFGHYMFLLYNISEGIKYEKNDSHVQMFLYGSLFNVYEKKRCKKGYRKFH